MPDDELMCSRLTEPLQCCGGVRTVEVYDSLVDGRTLSAVFLQHELWCCRAPARGPEPFPDPPGS